MKHIPNARVLTASAVAVAGLAAGTLAVHAQTPAGGPMMARGMAVQPRGEADVVRLLDQNNTAELEQAKYVVNRTKDAATRTFAQKMIDDHSTAAVKLSAVTRGTNLRPAPREMARDRMGDIAVRRLEGLTGTQLDYTYMRMQVPMHMLALNVLTWETKNGQNAGLKNLANDLTPVVQQHLQLAQTYLAAHNLTPYSPPMPNPVPGSVNPSGPGGGPGIGTPNNPAAPGPGSPNGQENASGGAVPNRPVAGPTYQPMGSGTPPANANGGSTQPAPATSPQPSTVPVASPLP